MTEILTLYPNWDEGLTERLIWKTTIAGSPTGAEQRMEMLEAPRRQMEYSALVTHQKRRHADNLLSRGIVDVFDVPMWFDYAPLTLPVLAGVTLLPVLTDGHGFKVGMTILVESEGESETAVVAAITSTTITTEDPITAPWRIATRVYPTLSGQIKDKTSWSQHTSNVWTCRLEVEITEPETVIPEWGAPVYRGRPVLTILPNMAEAMPVEVDRMAVYVDSGIGRPKFVPTSEVSYRMQTHSWLLRGVEEYVEFRAFLQTAAGRLHSFWLPSFANDFKFTEDVSSFDITLTVEACGYTSGLWADVNRRDLYIRLNDGTEIFRRISSTAEGSGVETITLSTAVGTSFSVSDVALVCLMSVARFDTDTVELFHPTDINGPTRVSILMRTVPLIRSAPAYDSMPFLDTVLRPTIEPPVIEASSFIDARIFWTTKLQARQGNIEYPMRVDGTLYPTGVEAVPLAVGDLVEYTGAATVTELFIELIALDDVGDPLPKDKQPKSWTAYPQYASSQVSVGKTTFKHFKPTYSPTYAGVHIIWSGALGAQLDKVVIKGTMPDTGEIRSFRFNYTRQSATFGPHRHWRIVFQEGSFAGPTVRAYMAAVEFRTAPAGPSITTGGVALKVSELDAGHLIANAYDGNPATDWARGGTGDTQWLGYSLPYGQVADVVQIMIKASATDFANGPLAGVVQYNDNRTQWVDAWAFKCAPWTAGLEQVFTATFAYRHWAVMIPGQSIYNRGGGPTAISGMRAYEEEGGTNIISSATVSVTRSLDGTHGADKIDDGNNLTYWSTHPDYINEMVMLDFGSGATAALVDLSMQARPTLPEQFPPFGIVLGSPNGVDWAVQWSFIAPTMFLADAGTWKNFPKTLWKDARRALIGTPTLHQNSVIRRDLELLRINPSYTPHLLLEGAIGVADAVYFEVEWPYIANYLSDHRAFVGVTGANELAADGQNRVNTTMVNYRGYSYHNGTGTDLAWTPMLEGARMGVAINRATGKYKVRFAAAGAWNNGGADLDLGSSHATEPYLFAFIQSYQAFFGGQTRGRIYVHPEEFLGSIPSGYVAISTLGDGTKAAIRWDEADIFGPATPFGDGTNVHFSHENRNISTSATVRTNTKAAGKTYVEIEIQGFTGVSPRTTVGMSKRSQGGALTDSGTDAIGVNMSTGNIRINGTTLAALGAALTGNGILRIADDRAAGLTWMAWNAGDWNGSPSNNPATGVGGVSTASLGSADLFHAVCAVVDTDNQSVGLAKLRNGAGCFYTAPSGFSALA